MKSADAGAPDAGASIVVRGAREHNLQGIDVAIPRDRLVVVTGVSGSGKSSLAFDTIYAEGQRRYVESLSAYARQFLGQNQKPNVESIEGLSPAIAIEQKSTPKNPRSTVGTLTEIYDYLRLLFARIGVPHCYRCGRHIQAQTVQQIVDAILQFPEGSRFLLLAPVVSGRKGEAKRELSELRKQGFTRVRIDGEVRDFEEEIKLHKNRRHTLEVVIDRLTVKAGRRKRLTDSVELALDKGDGMLQVAIQGGEEHLFSERFACHDCGISCPELEPRLFSFNSPFGACQACDGLGYAMQWDIDKLIPDPNLTVAQGAIKPWTARGGFYQSQVTSLADAFKQSLDKPWNRLSKRFRTAVLEGTGSKEVRFVYQKDESSYTFKRPFPGLLSQLSKRFKEASSDRVREDLAKYMSRNACESCGGARLRPEALAIKLGERNIQEACATSIAETRAWLGGLKLGKHQRPVADPVVREVDGRLSFLEAVGLNYLTLDRSSTTLSGGEAQRIRLATQLGSALRGVIYVLDEPSIGLHQRDNRRLLDTLMRLRDLGNTVLVVEHDEETIRCADHVIDMGPGAGIHGGRVIAEGPPEAIARSPHSVTGAYLAGRRKVEVTASRRKGNGAALRVRGARGNNLRGIDAEVPLGVLTCVTGVSGSGKSTLVIDTLYRALARELNGAQRDAAAHDGLVGVELVDKVIEIDQSPIGRTPRSNPATYTGVFTPIRELFAGVPDSRTRGYGPGRFSFNVKGGRCEACEGDGLLRIEMHFLPDVYVTCEQCQGRRYNRDTLAIRYKGKTIADVLEMTVEQAAEFLQVIPSVERKLSTLQAVGLGYITLGQSATTLSGGEAQRVKLSKELSKRATGRTLYILDEPTTGLHFEDVGRLLEVLHALVDAGNTVVVIEHNLDVIKTADHIIDLGPEGGAGGGLIVATGTPDKVAKTRGSHTGAFLAATLGR